MPPKPKYTKEQITEIAMGVVAKNGADALTAKELSKALGTSTSPIFTFFNTMREVQDSARDAAMHYFESYSVGNDPQMPLFKQIGMKMVMFGVEQPKLYQFLFMRENDNSVTFDEVFGELGETAALCVKAIENDYGLSGEKARQLFENVWIYTFGIGALCATGACTFIQEKLSARLSTQFKAMMMLMNSEQ